MARQALLKLFEGRPIQLSQTWIIMFVRTGGRLLRDLDERR
jgi:hypothetical protein